MKLEETPQDKSALEVMTKELCYVVDENGNYTKSLSKGWEVKAAALDLAWDDIEIRVESARQKVLQGNASPILYYMELKIMDLSIISAYTGFWTWQIKRHMKASVFAKLSNKKLQKYANLFEVSIDEIKTIQ